MERERGAERGAGRSPMTKRRTRVGDEKALGDQLQATARSSEAVRKEFFRSLLAGAPEPETRLRLRNWTNFGASAGLTDAGALIPDIRQRFHWR